MINKLMPSVLIILLFATGLFARTCGDVDNNNAINIVDALLVARYCTGLSTPTFTSQAADVNADNAITINDALLIAQYCAGLIPSLPVTPAFFVAPGGNDTGTGSISAPFGSITYALTRLQPGDTLYVRAGTYHESIQLTKSGLPGKPITVQAYPGEIPELVGATPVTGAWTKTNGSIYRIAWPNQPAQVFCDKHLLNEARWPDAATEGLSFQPVTHADSGSAAQINCSTLPALDLNGAYIQLMAGQSWCAYTRRIASFASTSGTITFDTPVNELPQLVPRRGDRFYLFGKLNLLDSPGEWYWDPAEKYLYVRTENSAAPTDRVEAGTAAAVLTLESQSFITIKGLTARGGWFNLQNSNSCIIQDCTLIAPNWTRIVNGYATNPQYLGGGQIGGINNQWLGGKILFAGRSGINISGQGHTVRDVLVEDSGWNWGNDGGIYFTYASQCLVESCTVRRTSREGIFIWESAQNRILDNLVEDIALYSDDAGNICTWGTDGQNTEIAFNTVRNNYCIWGAGIYLDENAKNFYVHDNLIENQSWFGITFKDINIIERNRINNVGHQCIHIEPPADKDLTGARVASNRLKEPFPLRLALNQAQITDYGYYGGYATLLPGSRRVEITWREMSQPWWAIQIPLILTAVSGISFNMECPATFDYTISNLRLLPNGQSGDTDAVPFAGISWYASGGTGATCTITASGPTTWGAKGTSVNGGWNSLGFSFPEGARDLSGFRGLAFELAGNAVRSYELQGCTDSDNGP